MSNNKPNPGSEEATAGRLHMPSLGQRPRQGFRIRNRIVLDKQRVPDSWIESSTGGERRILGRSIYMHAYYRARDSIREEQFKKEAEKRKRKFLEGKE